MKTLLSYITDARFYIPFGLVVFLEVITQSGLYKHVLQPSSYADNVNRIVQTINESPLEANTLILGTSVAYQGINPPLLNQTLSGSGLIVQSGACEGALLETQHLIYKSVKGRFKNLKYVVHVAEVTFPWTARPTIDEANRGMVAQFPRSVYIPLLRDYEFQIRPTDYTFFLFGTITYQRDFRDFVLDPLDRIKGLGRKRKKAQSDFVYVNSIPYGMDVYPAKDLQECIEVASLRKGPIPEVNAEGVRITDRHHREAVLRTCEVGKRDPFSAPGGRVWNELFFHRLKRFYGEIQADGVQIITVFAPYSDLVSHLNADARRETWEKELSTYQNIPLIDLRRSLDKPEQRKFFYDTIHLNKNGANAFTEVLAKELRKFGRLEPK